MRGDNPTENRGSFLDNLNADQADALQEICNNKNLNRDAFAQVPKNAQDELLSLLDEYYTEGQTKVVVSEAEKEKTRKLSRIEEKVENIYWKY